MNRNALMQYMATNPQNIGYYQMDDQSRQHQLDQSSAPNLMSYMDGRALNHQIMQYLNNAVGGLALGGGAVMTATGDPLVGLPTMGVGMASLHDAKQHKDMRSLAEDASILWGSDPFQWK